MGCRPSSPARSSVDVGHGSHSEHVSDQLTRSEQTKSENRVVAAVLKMKAAKTAFVKWNKRKREVVMDGWTKDLVCGKMDIDCPVNDKIVRIFTSSTFTDTKHERNALMKRVYPELRRYCQEQGFSFQVVDMRWGIRDEATNDHMTTELCLRELAACQKLSTGPNFVTFLSHKYGYRPLPRLIDSSEFTTVMKAVTEESDRQLLNKWYAKDENSVPASHMLQPISTCLPDYVNQTDHKARQTAKDTWWAEFEIMTRVLAKAAKETLTEQDQLKYIVSVTETEIIHGILQATDPDNHCIWFKRDITDINNQQQTDALKDYQDPSKEAQELLTVLKEDKIPDKLSSHRIISRGINWIDGLDPSKHKDYSTYIDNLCGDFERELKQMIQAGIEEHQQKSGSLIYPLHQEILQHTSFCQNKCQTFYGRNSIIQAIKNYMVGDQDVPLVVHGVSGSGKTSVMAKAASLSSQWMRESCVIILRFLGTTRDSSTLYHTLKSVLEQINQAYGAEMSIPGDTESLINLFPDALSRACASRPLVVFLDSLDQLDPEDQAWEMEWLPQKLPDHVKLVVSTLPDEKYQCFPRLQAMFKDLPNQFIEVGRVYDQEVTGMVNNMLRVEKRHLTTGQQGIVATAFTRCPLPLYLKLCVDHATTWHSYTPLDDTTVKSSVREMIDSRLARVETDHGHLLVSHALGYITLSRGGLADTELEDLLSCDEEVLDDVYQYWTPPVRRLPPLLLVRIKADLQQYLVSRSVDEVKVNYWYHRQFVEAARERYCSDDVTQNMLHSAMADYFLGKWTDKEKPFTDNGKPAKASRLVARQPLEFDSAYNLRKLMELPYHLVKSGRLTELKQVVLCNLKWLLAKLNGVTCRDILDDFLLASQAFPDDTDIKLLQETLQLSQEMLDDDPDQLPGQILGRMNRGADSLRTACRNPPMPCLLPDTQVMERPTGQLQIKVKVNKDTVTGMALMTSRWQALTCGWDGDDGTELKLWDLADGRLLWRVQNIPCRTSSLFVCCQDTFAITAGTSEEDDFVFIMDLQSRKIVHKIITKFSNRRYPLDVISKRYVPCGDNNQHVALLAKNTLSVYDVKTGERLSATELADGSEDRRLAGSEQYIAVGYGEDLIVVSLAENKVLFEKTVEEAEFRAILISPDSRHLYVFDMAQYKMLVYDIAEQLMVNEIQDERPMYCEVIHISPDGRYLYYSALYDDLVRVWDIKHGDQFSVLPHYFGIQIIQTTNMEAFVTIGDDNFMRVLTAEEMSPDKKSKQDESDRRIPEDNIVQVMKANPICDRYVVYHWQVFEDTEVTDMFGVYDLVLRQTVRSGKVTSPETLGEMKWWYFVDERHLVYECNRRLSLLDLDDMKTILVFQGTIPHSTCYQTFVVLDRTNILAMSRGGTHLKLYTTKTGRVQEMIPMQQQHHSESSTAAEHMITMMVSGDASVVVAETSANNIQVFSLDKRCHLHTLAHTPLSLTDAALSHNGKYMFLYDERQLNNFPADEVFRFPVAWNLQTGCLEREYIDNASLEATTESNELPNTSSMMVFQDHIILTTCSDHQVRTFDIKSGALLQIVHDDFIYCRGFKVPCGHDKQYLLRTDLSRKLSVVRVGTWQSVAHLLLDKDYEEVVSVGDGSLLVIWRDYLSEPFIIRLCGPSVKQYDPATRQPKPVFQGQKELMSLVIKIPPDPELEADDPDPDPKEEDEQN